MQLRFRKISTALCLVLFLSSTALAENNAGTNVIVSNKPNNVSTSTQNTPYPLPPATNAKNVPAGLSVYKSQFITITENSIFIPNAESAVERKVSAHTVYFQIKGAVDFYGTQNIPINNKYLTNAVFAYHANNGNPYWQLNLYFKPNASSNCQIRQERGGIFIFYSNLGNQGQSIASLPMTEPSKISSNNSGTNSTRSVSASVPVAPQATSQQPPDVAVNQSPIVMPNVATYVDLSSSDVNRIVCSNSEVKDVVFSQEKHLMVRTIGSNVFAKFQVEKLGDQVIYTDIPTDIYVVCSNNNVYNLIGIPKRIPSQTIYLGGKTDNTIKKNLSLFKGMPIETKVSKIIKDVYTGNVPDSFTITPANAKPVVYKDFSIQFQRTIDVGGEGLQVREYLIKAFNKVLFSEKDFINSNYSGGNRIVAVSLSDLLLYPGQTARLFVVVQNKSSENGGF